MDVATKMAGSLSVQLPTSSGVHVWRASLLQPPEVVENLRVVLSQEERKRAERYHFERDRKSFIVSRGILRFLLSRYAGIEPQLLKLEYEPNGKPFLLNGLSALHFNLSHSGDLVLYAFSPAHRVGIDIEYMRPIDDLEEIAEKNFSIVEFKKFRTVSEASRLRAFFNCWTRKEAFIKAIGQGLTFPLQEFDVALRPDEPVALLSVHDKPLEAECWSMIDLDPADGYAAALVVERNRKSIPHHGQVDRESMEPYWS